MVTSIVKGKGRGSTIISVFDRGDGTAKNILLGKEREEFKIMNRGNGTKRILIEEIEGTMLKLYIYG